MFPMPLQLQHGAYKGDQIPHCPERVVALHQAIDQIDRLQRNATFACPPDAFAIPVRVTQADLRALTAVLAAATSHLDERLIALQLTPRADMTARSRQRGPRSCPWDSRDFRYPRRVDLAYASPDGSSQSAGIARDEEIDDASL